MAKCVPCVIYRYDYVTPCDVALIVEEHIAGGRLINDGFLRFAKLSDFRNSFLDL